MNRKHAAWLMPAVMIAALVAAGCSSSPPKSNTVACKSVTSTINALPQTTTSAQVSNLVNVLNNAANLASSSVLVSDFQAGVTSVNMFLKDGGTSASDLATSFTDIEADCLPYTG